jgi:hypothetical protein
MTRDIFNSASGDAGTVLAAISSYDIMVIKGASGQTHMTRGPRSPVDINPYFNAARMNSSGSGGCGTADSAWTTNTLLHEGRHAYQAAQASVSGNDQDNDWLPKSMIVAPNSIFIDSTATRSVCDGNLHPIQLAYQGDGTPDTWLAPNNASYAAEMDAWTFAANHDH